MVPEPNFESMRFNNFWNNNNFSDSDQDPDVNFFLDNFPPSIMNIFQPLMLKYVSQSLNLLTHFQYYILT